MYNLHIFEREDLTPIRKLLMMHAIAGGTPLKEYEVEGNPVAFNTNVAKPLSVLASFSPVQAGSGDPSPENVRPITGFTGANIYLSPTDADDPAKQTFAVTFPALGKNLFDKNAAESGKLWWKGRTQADANYYASAKIPVIPGETYTLQKSVSGQNQVQFFDADGTYIEQDLSWSSTKTIPSGVYFVAFNVHNNAIDDAMFVKGSSAGSYEAFTNTAYGGTLALTTGVLTLSFLWMLVTGTTPINAGGPTYNGQTGTNRFAYTPNYANIAGISSGGFSDMMTRTNHSTWDNPDNDLWLYFINAGNQLHMVFENETVGITTDMTASERTTAIKAWLADNPITFVLPLATPVTYQLTPTEILSIIGNNVLWSDLNGDLTVKYKKKG